ncbi:MAG: phosphatidylglycerophosphatase A [Thermoanaerobaculia bacterium]
MSTAGLREAWRRFPVSTLFSTGLGAGLAPWAPGTAGSALGLAAAWLFARTLTRNGESVTAGVGLLMSALAVSIVAVPLAQRTARALGAQDPGCIVIDEVAGQLIASSAVLFFTYPSGAAEAGAWLASFLGVRLFDIWKPGPICRLQHLPGGLGIVIDDVLAGVLAFGTTAGTAWWLARQAG